jgi:phosphoribosylglycinamide formyltransferase-1
LQHQDSTYKIIGIICNNKDAAGLQYAYESNIATVVINKNDSIAPFVRALSPDLVVLAGYMKIITGRILDEYDIINIHPSLLPKYKGLHTHEQVLYNNDLFHGVTVHQVTAELDAGKILAQRSIPVYNTDTVESLSERLLPIEHQLYVDVIRSYYSYKYQQNDATVLQ